MCNILQKRNERQHAKIDGQPGLEGKTYFKEKRTQKWDDKMEPLHFKETWDLSLVKESITLQLSNSAPPFWKSANQRGTRSHQQAFECQPVNNSLLRRLHPLMVPSLPSPKPNGGQQSAFLGETVINQHSRFVFLFQVVNGGLILRQI